MDLIQKFSLRLTGKRKDNNVCILMLVIGNCAFYLWNTENSSEKCVVREGTFTAMGIDCDCWELAWGNTLLPKWHILSSWEQVSAIILSQETLLVSTEVLVLLFTQHLHTLLRDDTCLNTSWLCHSHPHF